MKKHNEQIPKNRTAVAPYNFVPLPEQVVQAKPEWYRDAHASYRRDRHTGRIRCTLTTETPLFVRCGLTPQQLAKSKDDKDKAAKDQPDFFYLDPTSKRPVIPGSSLRGLLRTLVEIASYSKIDRVTDRQRYFYRAVAAKVDDPLANPYRGQLRNVRAGYLKRTQTGWEIQPAQLLGQEGYLKVCEHDIPTSLGVVPLNSRDYTPQYHEVSFTTETKNGREIVELIDTNTSDNKTKKTSQRGWLVTSGNMLETDGKRQSVSASPRKNHAVIGLADKKRKPIEIDDQAIEDYRSSLTDFQQSPPFHEEWGLFKTQDDKWAEGRPIFYCEPKKGKPVTLFGHSPNFRVPYRFRGSKRAAAPADFVPDALKDKAITDIAEAIFGYVLPDKEYGSVQAHGRPQALAGRVFVGDAHCQQHKLLTDKPIAPRILSSPKPTTFQHYLVQPEARKSALRHYASHPVDETVIRGHKLYWHQGHIGRKEIEDQEFSKASKKEQDEDTQHTKMKPLAPGATFNFTVRFENLSDVELGALLWVLNLTDAAKQNGKEYRLKLGMGKPLGMGAVKLTYELELNDRLARYDRLFTSDATAWSEPQRQDVATVGEQAVGVFNDHVLGESEEQSPDGTLAGTLRIQMLLALLSWPGPLPTEQYSRYMEIERRVEPRIGNDPNEYKDRPVLPTPLQVAEMSGGVQGYDGKASTASRKSSSRSSQQSGLVQRINALSKDDPAFGDTLYDFSVEMGKLNQGDPEWLEAAQAIQAKIHEVGLEDKYSRRGWYNELLAEIESVKSDA